MKKQHAKYDKCQVAQDEQVGPLSHESIRRSHEQVGLRSHESVGRRHKRIGVTVMGQLQGLVRVTKNHQEDVT